MMKKSAVSTLFTTLFYRVHRTLFRHMVKSGLILCAVPLVEDGHDDTDSNGDDQDDQTGDDTGSAAENDLDADNADDVADNEVVITFGDEDPPASDEEDIDAPGLVNKLRKLNREKDRELRELRDKAKAPPTGAPAETTKVAKPTLAECEYDEEAFETKLTAWQRQQAKAEADRQAQVDRDKAATDAWTATLANHTKAKAALRVPDYDDAEAVISDLFNQTQRGIIVSGADNSAIVEYALGKNPAKAKEFASIKDPVKFAFAIAKLETQLKVTPRKAAPLPEKVIRGSAPVHSKALDTQLAKLEVEAERTGDRTKVQAFKREQRRAAA